MSSVASFVLRGLNRKKAALLILEAKHTARTSAHQPGTWSGCTECGVIRNLRSEVAAGEVALKTAEALR